MLMCSNFKLVSIIKLLQHCLEFFFFDNLSISFIFSVINNLICNAYIEISGACSLYKIKSAGLVLRR